MKPGQSLSVIDRVSIPDPGRTTAGVKHGWLRWLSVSVLTKGLVTNYGEGGGLQNGRGGGHVKFYPYEKGGWKKF